MAASTAGRILKRTLSGGALSLSLAGLLWWNDQSRADLVLLVTLALVLAVALRELVRMGRVAELGASLAWCSAGAGLLGLAFAARAGRLAAEEVHGAHGIPLPEALAGVHVASYGREALFAAVLAAGVWALGEALGRLRWIAVLAGAGVLVFLLAEPLESGARFLPALALAGLLLAGALPAVIARGRLRQLGAVAGLALWLVPALTFLPSISAHYGTRGLVALILISKIGDTGGYYGGHAFGRRHPFPGISPGKTEWGCVCSLLAALALALVLHLAHVLPSGPYGLPGALGAAAGLNLAAQSGDLFESWIKRRAGVKDSSAIFGPSGGLLDQLDSFLFTIPLAAATWPWLFPGGS